MLNSRAMVTVLLAVLLTAGSAQAQAFEGIIRQRSLTVSDDALYELLWAGDEEEVEYETEEAYNQAMAHHLFDLAPKDILAMVESEMAESGDFAVHIRGSRIRTDGEAGGAFSIYDLDSGTVWMVNPADRSYVEFSPEDAQEAQKKAEEMMARFGIDPEDVADEEEYGEEGGQVTVTDLNASRTINGFETRGFRASSAEAYGEAWCTEGGSELAASLEKFAEKTKQMEDEGEGVALEDEMCPDGLLVLSKIFHPYVVLLEVTEILAVETKAQDPGLFQVPEGYRRVELSDFWR